MRYLSICSGIEAATVAWHPLGWTPAAFSEIEPFPSAVLSHHYPAVPNLGDMTQFKGWKLDAIDLLVGGTPCQSFSVAGLRKGLDDPRGNLMLTYLAIADLYRPKWLVWENVPGVLSSNAGRDFGALLGGLAKLGYGFAYRILDAQYFGVPQRRRRVFVVGHFGDWRPAAAVLFERHSLQGHPAPRREPGKVTAPTIAARIKGGGGLGTDFDLDGSLIAFGGNNTAGPIEVAAALNACGTASGRMDFESETFIATSYRTAGDGAAYEEGDKTAPLTTGTDASANIVAMAVSLRGREGGATAELGGEVQNALRASGGGGDKAHVLTAFSTKLHNTQSNQAGKLYEEYTAGLDRNSPPPALLTQACVRRLTPRECERLQGFPDGYTRIPSRLYKSRKITKLRPADMWEHHPDGWMLMAADGPRYKALGNSMAVPCMHWLGVRIQAVESLLRKPQGMAA